VESFGGDMAERTLFIDERRRCVGGDRTVLRVPRE
jgi:hypothetical protein